MARKKTVKKKTAGKKKKVKKKPTKKKPKKVKKQKVKEMKMDEVTEEELIKEIAHLLHIGVPEKRILEVFEESGIPIKEAKKMIHEAKTIYVPALIKEEGEVAVSEYSANPWVVIMTILILVGIAIIALMGYLSR